MRDLIDATEIEAVAEAIFLREGICSGEEDDPFRRLTWAEVAADEYPVHAVHARDQATAAIAALDKARGEWVLPCDVQLPIATTIAAGCSLRTLVLALEFPGRPKKFEREVRSMPLPQPPEVGE